MAQNKVAKKVRLKLTGGGERPVPGNIQKDAELHREPGEAARATLRGPGLGQSADRHRPRCRAGAHGSPQSRAYSLGDVTAASRQIHHGPALQPRAPCRRLCSRSAAGCACETDVRGDGTQWTHPTPHGAGDGAELTSQAAPQVPRAPRGDKDARVRAPTEGS